MPATSAGMTEQADRASENGTDEYEGSGDLRSHPSLGPWHAAVALTREPQCARRRVPRQGWPAGAAVRRHHASRHAYGRTDPCAGEPADADRLSALALLRHRRRGVD